MAILCVELSQNYVAPCQCRAPVYVAKHHSQWSLCCSRAMAAAPCIFSKTVAVVLVQLRSVEASTMAVTFDSKTSVLRQSGCDCHVIRLCRAWAASPAAFEVASRELGRYNVCRDAASAVERQEELLQQARLYQRRQQLRRSFWAELK